MQHYCALWSIVFMMGFVIVFDGAHHRKKLERLFRSLNLFNQDEMDRIRAIWAACQET
ncbi:MAG: hypothetical protein ABSB88_14980 [Bryobacteraceae bacterium]